MDTSYVRSRVDLIDEEHDDAKEWNDVVNAFVDNEGDKLSESIEAVMAIVGEMTDPKQRFKHLYKVMTAVMDNQIQARFLEEGNE